MIRPVRAGASTSMQSSALAGPSPRRMRPIRPGAGSSDRAAGLKVKSSGHSAAAAALWPELFTFEPAALSLDPAPGRMGRILRGDGPANAELCIDVDAPALTGRIMAVLFGETVDAA